MFVPKQGVNLNVFGCTIMSIIENFASNEKANEVESFFNTKDTTGVERKIKQSLETVRNNAAWLTRDNEMIQEYLKKFLRR